MANPYEPVTVTNYNLSPPADDGTQTSTNKITWAGIRSKLTDPLEAAIEDIDSNVTAAMSKLFGGGSVPGESTDVTVVAGDQGKTFVFTTAGHALTGPDAAVVGNPFVFGVQNNAASGVITLTPHTGQSVNGAAPDATIALGPGQGGICLTDGSNLFYIGSSSANTFGTGTVGIFGQTAAPTGWTKDTSFDDAVIALTSGSVGDVAGTALSTVMAARTITAANLPDHTITITDPGHGHSISGGLIFAGGAIPQSGGSLSSSGSAAASNTTGISAAFGSTARGGSQTAIDFAAKRAKVIRATKN